MTAIGYKVVVRYLLVWGSYSIDVRDPRDFIGSPYCIEGARVEFNVDSNPGNERIGNQLEMLP